MYMAKPALNQNLYKYTYLSANGYLEKFRRALGIPTLDRATLTKLLKVFAKEYKLYGFIVPDTRGNLALYEKQMLNNILGIDETGFEYTKPSHNPYLSRLHEYIDRWDYEDIMKNDASKKKEAQVPDEESYDDDTDMEKVSQKLIDYQNLNENKKVRRIIVTESQYNKILNEGIEIAKYSVEPEKVKIVKKFLDTNFIKAGIPTIGEDGYPKTVPIVAMKGTDGNPVRNMTDKQLLELLEDKFQKIYSDASKAKRFLSQIIKDWYYGKISNDGMLSVNRY